MSLNKKNVILNIGYNVRPSLQIKLSRFIEMSEEEFANLIKEVEGDELFKRLAYPLKDLSLRVISYRRYPHTEIKANVYELIEDTIKDKSALDVEELILNYKDTLEIIKNIGESNFKRYFLYSDFDLPISELAKICHITEEEVFKVIEMMNEFFMKLRFKGIDAFSVQKASYYVIAYLYKRKGRFIIDFLDLSLARGLYQINYERLKELKNANFFSKGETKKLNALIEKLTLINFRNNIIFRILSYVIKKQRLFLETAKLSNLIPLTQRESAKDLALSLSMVSRAIRHKSVIVPWGEEVPLKLFFPSLKGVRESIVKEIFEKEGVDSDQRVMEELQSRYGIYISRRTIRKYRKELKIPPSGRKK